MCIRDRPRVPLDNNYYDLSDTRVLEWQTKIAKEHGIYGFCVYHYWFGSQLLLERPMELYLNDEKCDLPFCFSWANETWTNAWANDNEKDRKVLIRQEYGCLLYTSNFSCFIRCFSISVKQIYC